MLWLTLFIITALLLIAAGFAAAWFFMSGKAARETAHRLMGDLDKAHDQYHNLQKELSDQRMQTAEFKRQHDVLAAKAQEWQQQFELLKTQSADTFKALASDTLKQANEQFLQLARKSLEGEQEQAAAHLDKKQEAIKNLLEPIRLSLEKHGKAVGDIEKSREGAYHALRQQMAMLASDQHRLRDETANLVKALRRPEVRGRWGEMQLRRVVELAGMIDHCDFTEQVAMSDGRRPDMVVHLPAGRDIVVDAKTPIDAYVNAIETNSDDEREQYLDTHLRQIEQKVSELSTKSYHSQFERSPDFVVLFIPGEAFLQAAVQLRPTLMEAAMTRGVIIATPSTLIALLKAVALGWREERLAENAREVQKLGVELHDRVATLVNHLNRLGKSLNQSVEHYNKALRNLDSRVLVTARKFKELGAGGKDALPARGEVPSLEVRAEEITTAE